LENAIRSFKVLKKTLKGIRQKMANSPPEAVKRYNRLKQFPLLIEQLEVAKLLDLVINADDSG